MERILKVQIVNFEGPGFNSTSPERSKDAFLCPAPGEFALQRHLGPLICFRRTHSRDKQTDRPRYMRSNRPHLYAMHCDAS